MAKLKLQDKILQYFLSNGYTETEKSCKYRRVVKHPAEENPIFIGPKGSIRRGRCYTKSMDVSYKFMSKIMGDENLFTFDEF